MNLLKEKRRLVKLAEQFGQPPDPILLQELEELENKIPQKVFNENVNPIPELKEEVSIPVKKLSESTLVNPEPVLLRVTKDLELKVKYLEQWLSRIASTNAGGGAATIYDLDMPTKFVTTNYTIGRKDYYIGVSSSVKTYITLQSPPLKAGKTVVIKDESGMAQFAPIAIIGTIDNDVNGLEIRINNGAVTLLYRDGWRVI